MATAMEATTTSTTTTAVANSAGATPVDATTRVAPTFSTLPLGPLTTAVLYLTEGDLAQLLIANKGMSTSETDIVSPQFWRERCCSSFGRHVDYVASLGKGEFRAFLTASRHLSSQAETPWSWSAWGKRWYERFVCEEQLLTKSVGASSQDRSEENPSNTLRKSTCAVSLSALGISRGLRCQLDCGCVWHTKCYWSSAPSAVPNKDEWLEYDMRANGLAVVSSFVLTPYTSFWQPEQPTYNPIEACFQLTHPLINGGTKPYYESPHYRVEGSMKRQEFVLPQPILALGGRARIVLLGMAQRQTLGENAGETANHYHTCISFAALSGAHFLSCCLAEPVIHVPASESGDVAGTMGGLFNAQGDVVIESGSGRGETITREGAAATTAEVVGKKHSCLRIRWGVYVLVQPANPKLKPRKVKAFEDTTCLELLELYHLMYKTATELPRLLLAGDSGESGGTVLPTDNGEVLGDFAVNGDLYLVDPSR